jgi:hypothetical protein
MSLNNMIRDIPMTDGFSGAESASSFSQSKAERVSHSDYGFRIAMPLCGIGGVIYALLMPRANILIRSSSRIQLDASNYRTHAITWQV